MESDQIFNFKIGEFNCISIQDENSSQEYGAFFSNVPEDEQHLIPYAKDEKLDLSFNCLFIETGSKRVLIDTGNGVETDGKGRLFQHLETVGIGRSTIDIVVLTHAHADHYAGMLTSDGKKTFPNADYLMWREEWEFYSSAKQLKVEKERDPSGERFDFIQKWFSPLSQYLTLIDKSSAEIAPGIRAIHAPGHTHHHIAIEVESNGEMLLVVGDAFIHPLQMIHRHWHFPFEVDGELLQKSRTMLVEQAVKNKMMIHGYHFTFPGLGHLKSEGDSAVWQPI